MEQITWINDKARLGDLIEWENNPRSSTKEQSLRILESIEEYGQIQPLVVSPTNRVYDGHQRIHALKTAYGNDYLIEVKRASRELTLEERQKLTIYLHAAAQGKWDWDLLSNWDNDLIEKWGMDAAYLATLNVDAMNVREMLASNDQSVDELYKGMPEYEQEDKNGIHQITVHFETPEDVETFSRLINQPVKLTTKFIWFPAQEELNLMAYKAEDES